MSGSQEMFSDIVFQRSCARNVEVRQTLGREAFEPPTDEQATALWQNFHRTHPGLNSNLDQSTQAALGKLENAALEGNAQTLAEVVKASQTDPSADGALKAFQKELAVLNKEARKGGTNLFTQPDGQLERLSVSGGRVQMRDTGAITFSLDAHVMPVESCGTTPDGKPNSELRTLNLQPASNGEPEITARRTDRTQSEITEPAAFFNKFSPILQRELEIEGNRLL
jgi:hypothetical protein